MPDETRALTEAQASTLQLVIGIQDHGRNATGVNVYGREIVPSRRLIALGLLEDAGHRVVRPTEAGRRALGTSTGGML